MKSIFISILILLSMSVMSQDSIQVARLKSLKGIITPFSTIAKKDSIFLIYFWSTNSDLSIDALNAINANLEKWQSMRSFRFLAVCVDDAKSAGKVRPVYNMNSWTFEVYTDLYGDLRRALNSKNFPQSMIVYKNEVIYEQSGSATGSENYLIERIMSIKQ
jgi:hypothetical protein